MPIMSCTGVSESVDVPPEFSTRFRFEVLPSQMVYRGVLTKSERDTLATYYETKGNNALADSIKELYKEGNRFVWNRVWRFFAPIAITLIVCALIAWFILPLLWQTAPEWKINLMIGAVASLVASLMFSGVGYLMTWKWMENAPNALTRADFSLGLNDCKVELSAGVTDSNIASYHRDKKIYDKVDTCLHKIPACKFDMASAYPIIARLLSASERCRVGVNGWSVDRSRLLDERLSIFAKQVENLHKGKWLLDVGPTVGLTDADVVYQILVKNVIQASHGINIRAATLLDYIPWWFGHVGLNYLEAQWKVQQRICGQCQGPERVVERLFLFPDGAVRSLFSAFDGEKVRASVELDAHTDPFESLAGDYNDLKKSQVLAVLLVNCGLGFKVRILTPAMCTSKGGNLNSLAKKWSKQDLALVYTQGDANSKREYLYAIRIHVEKPNPRQTFIAESGELIFDASEVNKDYETYCSFVGSALDVAEICNEPTVESAKGEIASILKTAVDDRRTLQDMQGSFLGVHKKLEAIFR
ncbi:MAG: hypothetical protein NTZ09_02990 [Candidatus Hydrogenedentes bacterium]|nr:hypothetical protein [Candidatus Hydrogenedentota bacterium]